MRITLRNQYGQKMRGEIRTHGELTPSPVFKASDGFSAGITDFFIHFCKHKLQREKILLSDFILNVI